MTILGLAKTGGVRLGPRLALVLGVVQVLAWATTYYVPATMTGAVAAATGASQTALLGGFSWALLVTGFASPWIGRRIEQMGGRGVLASGAVVMAAGLMVMASWPGLPGWYLGWSIAGAGMALGLYDACFATIGRLLGPAARPAIVGVTLLGGFASSVGWPMGVALVHALGWRATLLVYAAIQLGVNLPLIVLFVPRISASADPGQARIPNASAAPAPEGRLAFVLLTTFFSIRAGISAVVSVQALLLLHGLGLPGQAAVGVAALIGPCQVLGRVLEWMFARNLDPLVTSSLGASLLPAGVAALLGGAPVAAFAVAYGMSNGVLTISRGTLPMRLFGPRGYATRIGRIALPAMLAQALAPTAVAPLVLAWPARHVFAALGAASLLALLCLLPLRFLIEPRIVT